MKKIIFAALIVAASTVFAACNNGSNGDRAKGGEPDTVGAAQTNPGGPGKDSTNGMQDTLKHK